MVRHALVALWLAALLLGGCSDPFREAAERDTAEAWRAYLAADSGSDTERSHARDRLDALLWEEASSLDTIASYRRYLEAFPRGRSADRAVARLETLRYERALSAGDATALEDFLARHPDGAHARDAQLRLAASHREAALESGAPEALESFLRRFPGAEGAETVEAALARVRFEEAAGAGTLAALERHRQRFPDGPHREEVEHRVRALRVRARILAGEEGDARTIIDGTGLAEARARLEAVAAAAAVEAAGLRLDLAALRQLAETAPDPASAKAMAIVSALEGRDDVRALVAAAERLDRADPGLSPAAMEAGLTDRDARRRWISARALGHTGHPRAIGPLAAALEDRNLGVRAEAAEALRRLGASMHPVVRDVYFTEALVRLDGVAADPQRIWMVAVLLEAAGHDRRAREALRRAAEDPDQVLARLRLARLESESHRRAVPLTGAAIWLRDAIRTREEALRTLGREDVDRSLLRQVPPLLEHLETAAALAEAEPDAHLRFTWLPDVRQLQSEMVAVHADAEARARLLDPTWVDHDVDEGAESRAEAARARAEAVKRLSGALPELEAVRHILERARHSPHPAEAEVAAAAREAHEG